MEYMNGMYLFFHIISTATTKLQSFLVNLAKAKHWDITAIASKLNMSDERYIQLRDAKEPWEQLEMLIYLSRHHNDQYPLTQVVLDKWHEYFTEALIYGQVPVLPLPPESSPTALQRLYSQGKIKPLLYATLTTLPTLDATASTLRITLMSTPNNYDANDTRCTCVNKVTAIRISGDIIL